MAGFYFGKSSWDNIPQTLGLEVEHGIMFGLWQGVPVEASFTNRYDRTTDSYDHYTCLQASLDPPLGVQGLEDGAAMKRIVDDAFRADVEARAKAMKLVDLWFADTRVSGELNGYESNPERYRHAFDLLVWAARIVMERRAQNPPAWERAIASEWPPLAQGWNFQLDVRRGVMKGNVRGRPTSASVVVKQGAVMTHVNVAVTVPPECTMSLTRQKDGFFSKLFRGQDIEVGDPAFDEAFVIKGEPEAFVRAALTPAARQQILGLTQAGASISLEGGKLSAWTNALITNREHLDGLMKAAFLAAEALCPPPQAAGPQVPYR